MHNQYVREFIFVLVFCGYNFKKLDFKKVVLVVVF